MDNLKELENKYLQAAELGDVEALVELGDFYMVISIAQEDSMDIDRFYSNKSEINFYKNKEDFRPKNFKLKGDGDYSKTQAYYLKAAEKGSVRAQVRLGGLYESIYHHDEYYKGSHGNAIGDSTYLDRAEKWYRKAVEQGDAGALVKLGDLYLAMETRPAYDDYDASEKTDLFFWRVQQDPERDYSKAEKCYLKAAELGHVGAVDRIYGLYSRMLYAIQGKKEYEGKKDKLLWLVEADKWFVKAESFFRSGNSDALVKLGDIYMSRSINRPGSLLEKGYFFYDSLFPIYDIIPPPDGDCSKAEECYLKAASLGHSGAQCRLGSLYHSIANGFRKKYHWTEEAGCQAELWNNEKLHYVKAEKWLKEAVKNGNEYTDDRLQRVLEEMGKIQIPWLVLPILENLLLMGLIFLTTWLYACLVAISPLSPLAVLSLVTGLSIEQLFDKSVPHSDFAVTFLSACVFGMVCRYCKIFKRIAQITTYGTAYDDGILFFPIKMLWDYQTIWLANGRFYTPLHDLFIWFKQFIENVITKMDDYCLTAMWFMSVMVLFHLDFTGSIAVVFLLPIFIKQEFSNDRSTTLALAVFTIWLSFHSIEAKNWIFIVLTTLAVSGLAWLGLKMQKTIPISIFLSLDSVLVRQLYFSMILQPMDGWLAGLWRSVRWTLFLFISAVILGVSIWLFNKLIIKKPSKLAISATGSAKFADHETLKKHGLYNEDES